jgi:hypothetical protein
MTESPIVKEWTEQAHSEGKLESRREDLLMLLAGRFPGQAIPHDVLDLVNQQTSRELLRAWFERAITTPSLAEYAAFLRR